MRKLNLLSQFCSAFVTVALLVLVLGGMVIYVLMDQGIWNPHTFFENTINNNTIPTAAPTTVPPTTKWNAPVRPPIAPIYPPPPGIGHSSSDDNGVVPIAPTVVWEPTSPPMTRPPTAKAPTTTLDRLP